MECFVEQLTVHCFRKKFHQKWDQYLYLKNSSYFVISSLYFVQKLKFYQSLPEVTEKYLKEKASDNRIYLECRTNKLASIAWKECYYQSNNIINPLNYASCDELYAANTCRNITDRDEWQIFPSPTELKSSIMHHVRVVKTGGCIGCFASTGNEVIRPFTKYYFKGKLLLKFSVLSHLLNARNK